MPRRQLQPRATFVDTSYRNNLVGAEAAPLDLGAVPAARPSPVQLVAVDRDGLVVAWTPPIGVSGMRGLVYVDARHSSEFNTGSDLDLEKIQDKYTVFNARVGLRGPDQRWAVELWAQNLFDKNYKQVAFDAPLQGHGARTVRGVESGFYPRSTNCSAPSLPSRGPTG